MLAVGAILASTLLIAISDVYSKLLTNSLPAIQVAWLRFLVFSILLLPIVARGRGGALATGRLRLHLARGVTSALATGLAITGFSFLPVAEATAIGFVAPIFVTGLAIVLLRETVGIRRWIAALLGFAGVMIIVQPGTTGFRVASLLPLAAAFASASSIVATRSLRGETAAAMLTYTALVGTAILTPFVLANWVPVGSHELGLALASGTFAALSNWAQIYAYRHAPASMLAPFTYAQMIWASVFGILVFGYIPGAHVLAGAAVIAASGIYTAYREQVRQSAAASYGRTASCRGSQRPTDERS